MIFAPRKLEDIAPKEASGTYARMLKRKVLPVQEEQPHRPRLRARNAEVVGIVTEIEELPEDVKTAAALSAAGAGGIIWGQVAPLSVVPRLGTRPLACRAAVTGGR